MSIELISHVIIVVICLVAAVIDMRTTKIPNVLTFPAAIVGIVFGFLIGSWNGALMAAAGWLIGAVLTVAIGYLPVGSTSGDKIGMGDAKLIAACGAFLGPKGVLVLFFYFCLCFGFLSFVFLARVIPWKQMVTIAQATVSGAKLDETMIDTSKLEMQRKKAIPISIAILVGLLITLAFQQPTLAFLGFA